MHDIAPYIFHNRAVAFLDVLGFQQFLGEFDAEARQNRKRLPEENEDPILGGRFTSQKANEFIATFKNAIEQLDKEKYRYYLFSDNICITSIQETTPNDLQDLLLVITKLYFDFAKKGYFLRGGVDYGLFIDEETIAVGVPLANAYLLESKIAIYPRIVLSTNIVDQFQAYNLLGEKEYDYPFADVMIEGEDVKYLNIFLQVFQSDYVEDKRLFFTDFNQVIGNHLEENRQNERIYEKYQWLAEQFNIFIDKFVNELAFQDSNFDPESDEDFLEFVKKQRINYGN
ncbi:MULTISPECIES: hypothetical protein [Olivibacter]|uniref:Uncharacterized protein n=2 Tax=Olivibacter TaxID=376469 RepID=A0ABV6HLX9_9SPHI|nr:hypothetical protein [Olivibacter jilunii]MDX3914543.1 hypothetical protein [Pseudosphingobacterium sp.]